MTDSKEDHILKREGQKNQSFYSTETSLPDTTTMTRVFKGNITFNGSGWHKIPLRTPFYYTGNNHLQITY